MKMSINSCAGTLGIGLNDPRDERGGILIECNDFLNNHDFGFIISIKALSEAIKELQSVLEEAKLKEIEKIEAL